MDKHDNSFNLLRLIFAVMVLASHAPELVDGDRHRELLTMAFGTYSFGEFAVNSFFILSGYLITASWLSTAGFGAYLRKRALRILPGFLVASAVSIVVFGPLGSATFWTDFNPVHFLSRLAFLSFEAESFPSNKHHELNGALWTIHYEFACYLFVALLGMLGLLKRRIAAGLFLVALALYIVHLAADLQLEGALRSVWYRFGLYVRFSTMFLAGTMLYFMRDRIHWDRRTIAAAAVAFVLLMFNRYTAAIAMSIPWAVLLFALGRRPSWAARKIGDTDLSYGIYLYAWPIQQYVIQSRIENVLAGFVLTLVGASIFAYLSWHLVEKPALRFKLAEREPLNQGAS